MTDLLTLARECDLPPFWDGFAVIWDDWDGSDQIFLCPPPKPRSCPCGSTKPELVAGGLIAHRRGTTHEQLAKHARPGEVGYRMLRAFRCPDCLHDSVHDMQTGEDWDLGPEDYGESGSVDPSGDPRLDDRRWKR